MHLARRQPLALLARMLLAFGAVLLAACGDDSIGDPAGPAAITRVSADSQTTAAGVPMTEPLVVLVTGRDGAPLPGTPVMWAIATGGGSLSNSTDTTDTEGHASTVYTPGTAVGTAQVVAQAGSLPGLSFTITLTAGAATALKKFGADNPAAIKGSTLTLSVKVVDQFGNGVQGATVVWTPTGGTTSAETSTTDSGGVASTNYVLGDAPGSYSLTASVSGLDPVTFTITAI
jgi:adhesin/invasin